jgi:hypothetical protein
MTLLEISQILRDMEEIQKGLEEFKAQQIKSETKLKSTADREQGKAKGPAIRDRERTPDVSPRHKNFCYPKPQLSDIGHHLHIA